MHLTPQEGRRRRGAHRAASRHAPACRSSPPSSGRSDGYPEIVWKAFALGVAAAALVVVALDVAAPRLGERASTLVQRRPDARGGRGERACRHRGARVRALFLNRVRAAGEVRQFAQAMFLERQVFRTRSRNGVLVLASRFERHVEIVADIGFDGRVDAAQWRSVVDTMMPALRTAARPMRSSARSSGSRRCSRDKASRGTRPAGTSFANRPIETEGER